MKRLALNTVINVAAFGAVSVIGLLLVPLLIGAYGFSGYGLIVLVRVLLPMALMGVFDLGLPDAATRMVATAREKGDDTAILRVASGTLLLSLPIVIILAAAGWWFSDWVTTFLFTIDPTHQSGFARLIAWTALAYLILFPGQVFEGIFKGLEAFGTIRAAEVGVAVLNAVGTVALVLAGASYEAVALLYLGLHTVRAFLLGVLGAIRLRHLGGADGWLWPDRQTLREVLIFARLTVYGKLLSSVLTNAPQLVIAKLIGSAGVGVFDALMRLPRFLKVVNGFAVSALLPVVARFGARGDDAGLVRILRRGTILSLGLFLPVVGGGIAFAPDIMVVWLGPDHADLSGWLALLFTWPLLGALTLVGSTILAAEADTLRRYNRSVALQVAVMFGLGVTLVPILAEKGFAVGIVAGTLVAVPVQLWAIGRRFGLRPPALLKGPLRLFAAGLPAAAWAVTVFLADLVSGPASLLGVLAVWGALYWAAIYGFGFGAEEREWVRRVGTYFTARGAPADG